jgi:hypothetical protein
MKPTLEQILDTTLRILDLGKDYWNANKYCRRLEILEVKQIVSYLGQKYEYSQPKIGRILGVDHSTVCVHKKNFAFYLKYDKRLTRKYNLILESLKKYTENAVAIKGWVARSENFNGCLQFFTEHAPTRNQEYKIWQPNEGMVYDIPNHAFQFITWETEPVECEITIQLKDEKKDR